MAVAGRSKSTNMKSIYTTGILQTIGGCILIMCGLVLVSTRYVISYRNNMDNAACGIWGGAVVLVAGIVGILGSYRRKWLTAYMICSFISIVFLVVLTVVGAVAAADNVHYWKEHPGYHHYGDSDDYPDQHGISITKLVFHLILCAVGCFELVVCVLAAVFCCTGICPGDIDHTEMTALSTQMTKTEGVPLENMHQPDPRYIYSNLVSEEKYQKNPPESA